MQTTASASPESPQGSVGGAGDRGDSSQVPVKEPWCGDNTSSESGRAPALTFDLLRMVVSYKRMAIYLEPLTDTLDMLRYLLGWRMPLCSLITCIMINVFFITLSEVAWFTIVLLVVSVPALMGYLGNRCQEVASETAMRKKQHHAVQRRELQTVHMTRPEALLEVKGLLKQLDDLLSQACVYAESMYKVLYWESHVMSSVFYSFVLVTVCLLYSAPIGWSLSLVNSTLFLWNKDFLRVLLQLRSLFTLSPAPPPEGDTTEKTAPEPGSLPDWTPTPTSLEDLSPGSVEEAEEAEPDEEFKDAIEENHLALQDDDEVSAGSADYDSVSDNGLLSRNEPIRSKVSKLTEKLRKRVPTNPTGNCSNCSAAFSVLKKRRYCTNCGVSFCSRCCSYKVFKSSMGATAPEAQKETVFVCGTCNTSLTPK